MLRPLLLAVAVASFSAHVLAQGSCALKPQTDATRCGVPGTILPDAQRDFAQFEILKVASKEDCAQLCSRRLNSNQTGELGKPHPYDITCASFYFDTSANICQLLAQNLQYIRKNAKRSTKIFYQADCFDCADPCADQPYDTNLLDNGGFEDGTFGPWWSDLAGRARGRNSKSAYQCLGAPEYDDGYGYDDCTLAQTYPTCRGSLYMTRFDYMPMSISEAPPGLEVEGSLFTSRNELVISDVQPADLGVWARAYSFHRHFVDERGTGNINFEFQKDAPPNNGQGYKVDNVYAARIRDPAVRKGAPNLLKNPGFETGVLTPWVSSSANNKVVRRKGPSNGKYAVQLGGTIAQNISTVPDTTYLLGLVYDDQRGNLSAVSFGIYSAGTAHTYEAAAPDALHRLQYTIPFYATKNMAEIRITGYTPPGFLHEVSVKATSAMLAS